MCVTAVTGGCRIVDGCARVSSTSRVCVPRRGLPQACRRSLFTAFPWSLSHIALFTASAITGSGIAMACAQAGDAADYENADRTRWCVRVLGACVTVNVDRGTGAGAHT